MTMTAKVPHAFDDMGGEFEARLRRNTVATRTSRNEGRELTVSNRVAMVEARFSYRVLDRLLSPSFVAIERLVDGTTKYVIYEVVGVNPTHYQLPGVDSSMPTLLRKEYLDTIRESWGKSQETWIDLSAIPTDYVAELEGGELKFTRAPHEPLPGAEAFLLSRGSVESFLCLPRAEKIGTMSGFGLPFTVDMANLIRYHCGFFAFSLDYSEPLIYRENGETKISQIGELVDRFYADREEGRRPCNSIEVVSFNRETSEVRWAPIQYVFRHSNSDRLLKFKLRTNRTVTVTSGHSLFVLRKGRILNLPASELSVGDNIVGARGVPDLNQSTVHVDLTGVVASKTKIFAIGVPEEAFSRVGRGSVPEWKWWRWRHLQMLPLTYWERLTESERDACRLTYKGAKSRIRPKLEVDQELAKLLGYYVAGGNVVISEGKQYTVAFTLKSDKVIIRELTHVLRDRFGISPRVVKHGKNGVRLAFNNRILADLLQSSAGTGAANKLLPSVILNSPKSVRRAFLRAWARGDYGVSVSKKLINDILYLLLIDGCAGAVNEWKPSGRVLIEGKHVNARPRFQFSFPRPADMIGTMRRRRKRSDPGFPIAELPREAFSLLLHPSRSTKSRANATPALLKELEARASKMVSYDGTKRKTAAEARHGGYYRRNMQSLLVTDGDFVRASPALLRATRAIEEVKEMAESNLGFYEVTEITEVPPTSPFVYDVSVPYAENFLAGFGGIFCHNTGSGKSNLTSALVRKAIKADPELTVVVFDIAGEYAVHLLDLLAHDSKIITTEMIESEEQFFNSQAVPESLEEAVGRQAVEKGLAKVYRAGVERLSLQEAGGIDLGWIQTMFEGTVDGAKTGGTAAKLALGKLTTDFYEKRHMRQSTKLTELDEPSRTALIALLEEVKSNVSDRSGIFMETNQIIDMLHGAGEEPEETKSLTPEKLAEQLARGKAARLNILYLPEPMDARQTAYRLITRLLFLKKRFGNKQRVLVVLDEAQEYIPDNPTDKAYTYQSNTAIEQLLRQGRKYRLHCWMATQRVAHLNVNALQQLHSYFVSTLPRMYDRMVIADAFGLPYEALERSAQLETGEWIFVSFKAAKQRNVPVFIKTENNETVVSAFLK